MTVDFSVNILILLGKHYRKHIVSLRSNQTVSAHFSSAKSLPCISFHLNFFDDKPRMHLCLYSIVWTEVLVLTTLSQL